MKKILSLIFSLNCVLVLAQNPHFKWAYAAGQYDLNTYSKNIVRDGLGNVYYTGSYSEQLKFGDTVLTNRVNGSYTGGLFLVKFDSSGNVKWSKTYPGTTGNSVAVDKNGNVYLTGEYTNNRITFKNNYLPYSGNMWNSPTSFFLFKFDSLGNEIWAKTAGIEDKVISVAVAIDNSGNVLVTGEFYCNTLSFDGRMIYKKNGKTFFLVKYNPSGYVLWTVTLASGLSFSDKVGGLNILANNETIVFGRFYDTIYIANNTKISASPYGNYLIKLDTLGNIIWAKNPMSTRKYSGIASCAIDSEDNLFLAGNYQDTVHFGNILLKSKGGGDGYIAKFNSDGNPIWAKTIGGTDGDWVDAIICNKKDGLYIGGGHYSNPIIFAKQKFFSSGAYDAFIFKLDTAGNEIWGKNFGGTQQEYATGIAVGNNDDVYLAGVFKSNFFVLENNMYSSYESSYYNNYPDNIYILRVDGYGGNPVGVKYDTIKYYKPVAIYDTITHNDTIHTPVYDTLLITVYDTLHFYIPISGGQPPNNINLIQVYANASNDTLKINTGNYQLMNSFTMEIVNNLGQSKYQSTISSPIYEISVNVLGGSDLYTLMIRDKSGNLLASKKIKIQ
ncbi:MAG: SBBP repeat-containing protein [Bacteroidetes bacterium]|nr:SBBP repeat-containing protein [Bacteroidota bacterium]